MRTWSFDIETTGLNAAFDHILVCCFARVTTPEEGSGELITFRLDSEEHRMNNLVSDQRLIRSVVEFIDTTADHLVSWNGKRFDIRFIKARALKNKVPGFRSRLFHTDCMNHWRAHMGTRGSRLEMVNRFLKNPEQKTPLDEDTWAAAGVLDSKAMDAVVEHCEQDVKSLANVYWRLLPYMNSITRQS